MKKIKLMLEYKCYPIWIYNGEGELIGNELPKELDNSIEVTTLLDEIQKTYDDLFIDNEIVFEYQGFLSISGKESFLQKIDKLLDSIKNILDDSYIIESKIDI